MFRINSKRLFTACTLIVFIMYIFAKCSRVCAGSGYEDHWAEKEIQKFYDLSRIIR